MGVCYVRTRVELSLVKKIKTSVAKTTFEQIPIALAKTIAERELNLSFAGLASCAICGNPVKLEESKTDERGKAVHESCYLTKMSGRVKTETDAR